MSHTATHRLPYAVDLNSGIRKVYIEDILTTNDHEAHQLDVQLFRGNSPVQLPSGAAVTGYFIRYSDNGTVMLDGTASGNMVSVALDKTCYALPGQFAIIVKVMEGESITPVLYAEGSVKTSSTDNVIDPGNKIPSLDDLLAQIAAMEAATAEARTAAASADAARLAIADDLSQLKDTKADAIMDTSARAASHELHAQDGKLHVTMYGKTTETGSGDKSPDNPYTISGVDAASVHVGSKNLFSTEWEQGTINSNGGNVSNASHIRTVDMIAVAPNTPYAFRRSVATSFMSIRTYDKDKKFIGTGSTSIKLISGGSAANPMNAGQDTCVIEFAASVRYFRLLDASNDLTTQYMMVAGETPPSATEYEPYNANTYTLPLLPDGAPLHGNGTVDDTAENDVLVNGERKCRVTRRWKTQKLIDRTWNKAGTNSAGLTVFYSACSVLDTEHVASAMCNVLPTVNNYSNATPCFYAGSSYNGRLWVVAPADVENSTGLKEWLTDAAEASYLLATPETYVTDAVEARKPNTLESATVTVTGSGETEVTYPCDTKTYIDRKFDALAAALLS